MSAAQPQPLSPRSAMAQGSPHDAYRFNNHRHAAAAMMSPAIIPAGLEGYPAALLQGASPYDQMSFAMSQLALSTPHLPHADAALAAHGYQPAFSHAAPPFAVPAARGHRRTGSGHMPHTAPPHDKRFAPPPAHFRPRQPPSAPHHAAGPIFVSPFVKPMHMAPSHGPGAWTTPGAMPRPRMNARVPSTLNSHKVRPSPPLARSSAHGATVCSKTCLQDRLEVKAGACAARIRRGVRAAAHGHQGRDQF